MPNTKDTGSVSSTLTSISITTPSVVSDNVKTNEFSLNAKSVSDITDIHTEHDPNTLVTAFALDQGKKVLATAIDELANDINNIVFSPVLSNPIVNPFFLDENWILGEWITDNGKILYINKKLQQQNQATMRVKSDAITKIGTYFFDMKISSLPSGNITLTNEDGALLNTFSVVGQTRFEVTITDPSVAYFEFTANDVEPNHVLVVDYISIHYVKSAFESYMEYAAAKIVSGGSGFVSIEQLQLAINAVFEQAKEYTNNTFNSFGEDIRVHLSAINNPHGVTPSQIGAAPTIHTHDQYALISDVDTWRKDHLADINPHKVTYEQTGAAPKEHRHTADEVNASPLDHTHILTDIQDIQTLYDKFDAITENLDMLAKEDTNIRNALITHKDDNHNPHGVTKEQLGLGDILNGKMATQQEAIDGILENVYINPKNIADVLTYHADIATRIAQTLTPQPIAYFSLTQVDPKVYIPIATDRVYHISFKMLSASLKKIRIQLSNVDGATFFSSFMMGKNLSINSVAEKVVGWYEYSDIYWPCVPPESGLNYGKGDLILNTFTMSLTGSILGMIMNEEGDLTTATVFPVQLYNQLQLFKLNTSNIKNMSIYLENPTPEESVDVLIYELVSTPKDPNMVVDAVPVGTIITRYGNTSIFPGYCQLDGSELDKTKHLELFNYAQDNNLCKSLAEYQSILDIKGFTGYFGYDEGTSTFKIPKDSEPTDNAYRYMKIDGVSVPDSSQILYRYVWNN